MVPRVYSPSFLEPSSGFVNSTARRETTRHSSLPADVGGERAGALGAPAAADPAAGVDAFVEFDAVEDVGFEANPALDAFPRIEVTSNESCPGLTVGLPASRS